MRRLSPPLRVIEPPPSMTTSRRVLRTFAVARMRIVTGLGPHENLIRPPARTAATTAAEGQLRGVPLPITRVGVAAVAAAGIEATPTTTASPHAHAIAATRRVIIASMVRAGHELATD